MPDIEKINNVAVADISKLDAVTFAHGQKVNNQDVSLVTDAHTLIATATASSSASLSFTSGIDSTYDVYEFVFTNLHAQTNDVLFEFQVNATDGADYNDSEITTTFFAAYHDEPSGTFASGPGYDINRDFANSTDDIYLTAWVANGNDESLSGKFTLYAPSSTTYVKQFMSRISNYKIEQANSDTYVGGYINDTTAIDDIRFKMTSGNIDSGTIKMYGLVKS